MKFNSLPEFEKAFRRLSKKYRSLGKDLYEFKRVLAVRPLGNSKHFHVVARHETIHIIKARFFCEYLKGSSFRIVYSYFENPAMIEFIEIYFKGDRENEDRERIRRYLENHLA